MTSPSARHGPPFFLKKIRVCSSDGPVGFVVRAGVSAHVDGGLCGFRTRETIPPRPATQQPIISFPAWLLLRTCGASTAGVG